MRPPWTQDPILQAYRFCHIFREDDKTTAWFRTHVRDPLAEDPIKVSWATVGFRWFNRIETGERIQHILVEEGWNTRRVRRALRNVRPLVTGAYLIKTPANMNKLEGILWCMDQVEELDRLQCGSLELAHQHLCTLPYLGPFMAYEVITDLRHTCVLRNAADVYMWANPGPGATRGLALVFGTQLNRHRRHDVILMMLFMRELLCYSQQEEHWPMEWPTWDMRTIEHTLCEYDKYIRAVRGQRLKRRYTYAGDSGA